MLNDDDVDEVSSLEHSSDVASHETDRITMKISHEYVFPIKTLVIISITILCLSFIAVFSYRRIREKSNPLNYKDNCERDGSRKANEDFSEIRFLTSDETLDFNMMTENDF